MADLVTRQLNCPDFRLQPDQVGWVLGLCLYLDLAIAIWLMSVAIDGEALELMAHEYFVTV
jgi:hypothetical protein